VSEAVVAAMDGIYGQMHNIKPPIMHHFLGPIPLSISGSLSTDDASRSTSHGVDSEDVNIDPSLAVYPEDASTAKVEHCSGKKIKSRRSKKEALKAAEYEELRHSEIVNLFQQKWEQDKFQDGVKGLQAAHMARSRLERQKHDHGLTYVDS
jgi:hypothetical protein